MQLKYTTKIEINKVGIEFTNKKITAYGGFSLLTAFFEKINLRDVLERLMPIKESSPNTVGIYSKILAYILTIYAGGNRFSHLMYLGCHEILSKLFAVGRFPLASTTLTRLFRKLRKMKGVEVMSEGIWITEFMFRHDDWRRGRRYIAIRQDIKRREHAMGKTLPLFGSF